MKILAIDTACGACSVGVSTEDGPVAVRSEPMMRGHAEALLPMVRSVMADAGIGFPEISLIAVTVGPGSFTGLRTGLAAGRALGLALDLPVAGVTTLEAVAAAALAMAGDGFRPVLAALETRREDLYVQLFDAAGHGLETPRAQRPEETLSMIPEAGALIAGDGAARLIAMAPASFRGRIESVSDVGAPDVAFVAAIAAGRLDAPVSAEPLYIHPPAVRRPGSMAAVGAS